MQSLHAPKSYPPSVVAQIEAAGSISVTIANRWMLGWPDRVSALLKSGEYLECLANQVEQGKDVFANEANLRHLSRREILQLYEIREAPPTVN